ncbi:MAG: MerR family transcriptional regulator [Hyphomonadaceae bacterium]|jgi:DNA-binding transcriptional MerR regulator|nr:MerR family transcriptional regulator [Hyphomonadaceae bacterium]
MKPNVFQETAAAVAKRFGVSVKALRVYEDAGLLKPARTVAGWRIYRQPEIERLSAILALKQLGLPLKRIGELLRGSGDLAAALALQEAALEDAKAEAEEALRLVRAARAKLKGKQHLSPDELGKLVRSTAVSEFKWNDKMEALAQKHYTPEQLAEIRSRGFTADDQKRVGAAWAQIYADIDALGPDPDPATPRALAIGRRAQALIQEFTQGDPALFRAAGAMNREAMADPEIAQKMPTKPSHWQFMSRVFAELKK